MAVTLTDVSFGYHRDEPIVERVRHSFGPGLTAITGPSGCGKSTLLYLIGLLLTPWAGRIGLGGISDASHLADGERSRLRARHLGFVFQDAMLDPSRSVLDNVVEGALYADIPRAEAEAEALRLLGRFDVRLRANHRPGEVSGGQAQRVALCRALVTGPEVILADEPTGNLDSASADVVMDALREQADSFGRVVIVASHDPRVVASCDEALEL